MGLGLTQYAPSVIYVSVFIAAFLTVFYKTEIGLYFLIPLIPFENLWIKLWTRPLGTNLIDILIIALLIGWFLRRHEPFLEKNPFNWPIILLLLITLSSFFIGGVDLSFSDSHSVLARWKNFMIMPVLFLITINNVRSNRQIKILIALMAFSMFTNAFYFRSTFMWVKTVHFISRNRVTTYVDLGPNEMASFVAQGTMLLAGIWLVYKHKLARILIGIIIAANMYVILYSFSRGAYMAVFISSVFLGVVKDRRILIVLVFLLIGWHQVLPISVVERIEMTTNEQSELDHSSQVRVDVWKEGLSAFVKNPLGTGFDSYQTLGFGDTGKRDAHNMFVKMLVELGVQGLTIFLLLYWVTVKSGWRLYRSSKNDFSRGLGLGLIACVIVNMVTNLFGQNWLLFTVTSYYWIFAALVVRSTIMIEGKTVQTALKSVYAEAHSHA